MIGCYTCVRWPSVLAASFTRIPVYLRSYRNRFPSKQHSLNRTRINGCKIKTEMHRLAINRPTKQVRGRKSNITICFYVNLLLLSCLFVCRFWFSVACAITSWVIQMDSVVTVCGVGLKDRRQAPPRGQSNTCLRLIMHGNYWGKNLSWISWFGWLRGWLRELNVNSILKIMFRILKRLTC